MDFTKLKGELETALSGGKLAFPFTLSDTEKRDAQSFSAVRERLAEFFAVEDKGATMKILAVFFALSFFAFITVFFGKGSEAPIVRSVVSEESTQSPLTQRVFAKKAFMRDPFAVGSPSARAKKAPTDIKLIGIFGAGDERRIIVETKGGERILSEGERAGGILLIGVNDEEKTATIETNGQIYELEMTR